MISNKQNYLIKESDIQEFEKIIKAVLPQEYRKFLLGFNGEDITCNIFKNSKKLGFLIVNKLYNLKAKKSYNDLEENYSMYNGRIMGSFIAIGNDPGGNQFCLGIDGVFKDKIYFWDHNEEVPESEFIKNHLPENMYLLADSFDNFINQLKEDE